MALIVFGSNESLEVVPMQVERMLPGVIVVEDDLDDLILLKDEGIGIITVNGRIGSICSRGKYRI